MATTYDVDTRNEANGSTQRQAKIRRRIAAREATTNALAEALGNGQRLPSTGPWLVRLVRLSPGELDDDAVPGALKTVRDTVAAAIGIDDGDRAIAFTYGQAYRRDLGVRIEVWSAEVRDG